MIGPGPILQSSDIPAHHQTDVAVLQFHVLTPPPHPLADAGGTATHPPHPHADTRGLVRHHGNPASLFKVPFVFPQDVGAPPPCAAPLHSADE